ncbi:MAG: hypothetical protein HY690_03605 [Chloroflexi bacterium]|nr:hypothetical protein [Chloroflexota bacterium]
MATEVRPRRPTPRLDLSGSEWKLYLVAALGLAYTATWVTLDRPTSAASDLAPGPTAPILALTEVGAQASPEPAQYIWLHQLPTDERPMFHVPAGWMVAPAAAVPPDDISALGRAPLDAAGPRRGSMDSSEPGKPVPPGPPAAPAAPLAPPPAVPSLPPPPAPSAGAPSAPRQAVAAAPPPPPGAQAVPPPPRSAPRTARARIMTRSS